MTFLLVLVSSAAAESGGAGQPGGGIHLDCAAGTLLTAPLECLPPLPTPK
ncbi:hypothetical protein [Deinococcus arenae]|nr:hypothetical protein [Deinococcus arenae]